MWHSSWQAPRKPLTKPVFLRQRPYHKTHPTSPTTTPSGKVRATELRGVWGCVSEVAFLRKPRPAHPAPLPARVRATDSQGGVGEFGPPCPPPPTLSGKGRATDPGVGWLPGGWGAHGGWGIGVGARVGEAGWAGPGSGPTAAAPPSGPLPQAGFLLLLLVEHDLTLLLSAASAAAGPGYPAPRTPAVNMLAESTRLLDDGGGPRVPDQMLAKPLFDFHMAWRKQRRCRSSTS